MREEQARPDCKSTKNQQDENNMKKNQSFLLCGVLSGIIAFTVLTGCKSTGKGGTEPESGTAAGAGSNTNTQKVEFLFVQTAKEVSFANGSMTLHGVSPLTVCFADRPERIAGHMPTANVPPMWDEGKNSFLADPPNATLSIL